MRPQSLMRLVLLVSLAAVPAGFFGSSPGEVKANAGAFTQASGGAYSDEFNSSLDPKFFFDNPAPNPGGQSYSLTANPGFLRMTTTGSTDLCEYANTAPKILENAPPGDFQIVSRVLAAPDAYFEHAGIIVIQDSTHWIRLIRDSNGNGINLQEGHPGCPTLSHVDFSGGDVVLKLSRSGNTYQAAFSTNGVDFTPFGTTVNSLTPTYIGMTVVSTPPDNVFSADFDYFRVSTPASVGGIAELPDRAQGAAETSTAGQDSSSAPYAGIAGAAGLIVVGVGGLYARRRWRR